MFAFALQTEVPSAPSSATFAQPEGSGRIRELPVTRTSQPEANFISFHCLSPTHDGGTRGTRET